MALLFAEGFDDFAGIDDLQTTGAATDGLTVVTGRAGRGKAVHIPALLPVTPFPSISWSFASATGRTVIAGFALQGVGASVGASYYPQVVLSGGADDLFFIRQVSTSGLSFYDASRIGVPGPGRLLGTAAFGNWTSYIEVKLSTGLTGLGAGLNGHAIVRINGSVVLDVDCNLNGPRQVDLASPVLITDTTLTTGVGDPPAPLPFFASLGPYGGTETYEVFEVTATSGIGGAVWSITRAQFGTAASAHAQSTVDRVQFGVTVPINSIRLDSVNSGAAASLDDLYVCDNTGLTCNDFLGDTRIISDPPSGDGADRDWTPDSGAAHYARVAEYPLDYDARYVNAIAAGQSDTYTFPALSGVTGVVRAVQVRAYATTDSGGVEHLNGIARIAGVDYPGPAGDKTVPSLYRGIDTIFEVNPATSAAWTVAGVDSTEFGQKRTA